MGTLQIISASNLFNEEVEDLSSLSDVIVIPADAFHATTSGGAVFTSVDDIPAFAFEDVSNSAVIVRVNSDGRIETNDFDITLRLKAAADEDTDMASVWNVEARLIRIGDASDVAYGTAGTGTYEPVSPLEIVADNEESLKIRGVTAGGTVSDNCALEIKITRDAEVSDSSDTYPDDMYFLAAIIEINK